MIITIIIIIIIIIIGGGSPPAVSELARGGAGGPGVPRPTLLKP